MKKRTTFIITLIAIMTALTTACGTAKESSLSTSVEDKPQATTSISTTETTTAKPAETTETTQQTTVQTTTTTAETTRAKPIETTAPAPVETTVQTTPVTVTQAEPVHSWTESEYKATMYVNESCYSRENAIIGAYAVKSYSVNTKVSVIAKTNTGYFKLADGTFIHEDYLSKDKVKVTATTTAKPKPAETTVTTKTEVPKLEEDTDNWRFTKADCEYILKECEKYAKKNGYKYLRADQAKCKPDGKGNLVYCKVGEVYQYTSWTQVYANYPSKNNFGRWKGYSHIDKMIGLLCENIELNNSDGYTTCVDYCLASEYYDWAVKKGWDMSLDTTTSDLTAYVFFPTF